MPKPIIMHIKLNNHLPGRPRAASRTVLILGSGMYILHSITHVAAYAAKQDPYHDANGLTGSAQSGFMQDVTASTNISIYLLVAATHMLKHKAAESTTGGESFVLNLHAYVLHHV